MVIVTKWAKTLLPLAPPLRIMSEIIEARSASYSSLCASIDGGGNRGSGRNSVAPDIDEIPVIDV
jgi:hypothetical protein